MTLFCLESFYELMYAVLFIGIVIFDTLRNPERPPGESEMRALESGRGGGGARRTYRLGGGSGEESGGHAGEGEGKGDAEVRKRGRGHGVEAGHEAGPR